MSGASPAGRASAPGSMLGVRLGFAAFGAFWGTWAVAALDIQDFLGLSDAGLGLLVATTVIGTSFTNVLGGTVAERRGAEWATALSLTVWGVLVLLAAVVPNTAGWMLAFLAVVAAGGMLDVILNIASTGALQDRPGPLLRVHASYNIGSIAGAAATGIGLALIGTWRWSFAAVGLTALLLAAQVHTGRLPIPPVTSQEHTTWRDAAGELRRSGLAQPRRRVRPRGDGRGRHRHLRCALPPRPTRGGGARRRRRLRGGPERWRRRPRFALGSERAGRHLGGPRPARLGLALASVGLVVEVATDLPAVAALGLAIASIGAATYWPLLSAVATRASDRPGLAVGGVSAAGYIGFLAGPPIVGAIAEGAGLRAGVLALAVAGAAAAAIPLRGVASRILAPA